MTVSRRTLLAAGLVAGIASARADAGSQQPEGPVDKLASDENYWRQVASHYEVTREVVQLEHGNFGTMSRPVLAAYERHQQNVNRRNSFYTRREYGADLERVRARVATTLGVAVEEVALTRGATEALQALIGGYNRLRPGDAVLYADLDYDSMQTAMNWLKARRGVDVVKIALPEPATYQSLIDAYAAALDANPKVRLMLLTHVSHRTGLVLPVKEIVAMARARKVDTIVDAAHALGQLEFTFRDLGVDFAGINLHKWMGAPVGVGVMYIRRERIADIDTFMADDAFPADDIRAHVHTGTANFAAFLTVPDALDFHASIGTPAKEARLRYLRDLWAEKLRGYGSLEILTPQDRRLYCGITSFRLRGRANASIDVAKELLERDGIFTVHRKGVAAGDCVRVTPAVFTSAEHVQRLVPALERIARV